MRRNANLWLTLLWLSVASRALAQAPPSDQQQEQQAPPPAPEANWAPPLPVEEAQPETPAPPGTPAAVPPEQVAPPPPVEPEQPPTAIRASIGVNSAAVSLERRFW